MTSMHRPLVQVAARLLEPREREVVLGDLLEAGEGTWQGLLDVLGLAIRRQLSHWKSWQPWLSTFGLALPGSLFLMGISVSVGSMYERLIGHGILIGSQAMQESVLQLLCRAVLLIGCSWSCAFVMGSISRRTLGVSIASSCLACLFCLARFREPSLPRLCLFLFLAPAIWGVRQALRSVRINLAFAISLAIAITTLTILPSNGRHLWTLNWSLVWPSWYIVATAPAGRKLGPMISRRARHALVFILGIALAFTGAVPASAASAASQVIVRELRSQNFARSKTGTDPVRKMLVYLPAGYDASSSQRYPVIYFLPNPFEESYRFDFDHRDAQGLFDRAIAESVIRKFILVAADMNTPLGTSWYVNSSATGNWEDFMIQELVPYVDANFKTVPNADSRGTAGIFIGGYGAIRFAMRHPDVFRSVYAMHPVGTGTGVRVSAAIPKWDILVNAKSMGDVKKDGVTQIFATMFQAHLPNPGKPPLFIDLLARQEGDQLIIDAQLMERFRNNFYLETMIPQYAANLKSLRGFKFDWTRKDANFDHVYANQAFTRKLNEFGITHEAEEYNGEFGADWGADGRFYTEALPFFQKHLVFTGKE